MINYYLGRDIVRAYVERGAPDAKTRRLRMRHVLSDTVLPADLLAK